MRSMTAAGPIDIDQGIPNPQVQVRALVGEPIYMRACSDAGRFWLRRGYVFR